MKKRHLETMQKPSGIKHLTQSKVNNQIESMCLDQESNGAKGHYLLTLQNLMSKYNIQLESIQQILSLLAD